MSRLSKITSVLVSVTTVIWVSGSSLLIPIASADHSTAHTIQQLLDEIGKLQAQLTALQGGGQAVTCNFTRSLTVGSTGDDAMCLQKYLNGAGFQVAASGAGSPGSETTYFGSRTRAAVAAWQAANGVAPAVGYFGPISRAKYNALVAGGPTPTPTPTPGVSPTPAPPGSGLAAARSGTQPKDTLHPNNSDRVAYTYVDFTASADGDVTVDSVTVERQGPSTDGAISGVVLLDEDGVQVGLEKTLNSAHQAILTEDFVVKAGQTRRMAIGANRTTGGNNGDLARFAMISAAAAGGAKVTCSGCPFAGATHTINTGLSIGTFTVETGPLKSVSTTTEDVGKTMTFTAIKIVAGSTEDIQLKSIRFNQVGTIGKSDISDVAVKVDGKVYAHTISSDGKYYTAKFSDVKILKGNNIEVAIGGTLTGGTSRTIKFDVYRITDIAVDGLLYGYGIRATASTGFTTTNPVYFASQITVGKATISVEKDPAVTAQNIAINLSDQPIGGFIVDVKGEPISVASMVFRIGVPGSQAGTEITQIKMVGPTGILAGPVDGAGAASTVHTVTFSDTVVFPVGKTAIKLTGKMGTAFANNQVTSASTTPSTNWTTVTGQNTGETITPTPTSAVSGNTMTIKGAALTISVAATPIAQTVVSGITQFAFATYQLDATQSGEDMRFVSLPLEYNVFSGDATNLTSCQLYDATKSVTTGSNVINPTGRASSTVYTFDGSGFVIAKGTIKNLDLKCNIAGGATGSYSWGFDSGSSPSATGLTSGQSATLTKNDSAGQRMTLAAGGSYSVTDDSTPGYRVVNSGATGVTLLRIKLAAQNEDIDIQRVNFQLSSVATNTPVDLANNRVNLYDEAAPTVLIGTAEFTSNGDFATSTRLTNFIVPKGGAKVIIVKGDIAAVTTSGPLLRSGDLLAVDYDGNANGTANGNYGTGVSSGTTIAPSSSDTAVGGVRIFKAYPEFAKIALTDKVLRNGDNTYPLYRFSVKGVGGDVHLFKLTFNFSSTSITGNASTRATTSKYSLYAYTDASYTLADTTSPGNGTLPGLINGGQCYTNSIDQGTGTGVGIAGTDFQITPTSTCLNGTTTYKVPTGVTRYIELRANIASVESAASAQDSIDIVLRGDAAFPVNVPGKPSLSGGPADAYVGSMGLSGAATTTTDLGGSLGLAGPPPSYGINADAEDDFIWSPGSTSTSPTILDLDFTNGYQIPGLPANDMPTETFTSTN